MYCTDRTHLVCAINSSIVTLPRVLVYHCGNILMKRPRPTLRVYTRLVPRLTYGLHHISGFGGSDSLTFAMSIFATEGSDMCVIETISELCFWLYVRRHRNGSISKALSAT